MIASYGITNTYRLLGIFKIVALLYTFPIMQGAPALHQSSVVLPQCSPVLSV